MGIGTNKKNKRRYRPLFAREFIYQFTYISLAVAGLTAVAIILLFVFPPPSLPLYASVFLAAALIFFAALTTKILSNLFIKVVVRLDDEMQKRNVAFVKKKEKKGSDFAESILSMMDDYESVTTREYSNLLLQKQAQFNAMQSQINPHFLYNTLDSIRGKAIEDGSKETAEMLETLASLFRYSIGSSNDLVTLGQEIANVDSFMKIQNYRFRNRFTMIKNIETQPEGETPLALYKIPKLTLQPIVENAIYHGLDKSGKDGVITLRVYKTQSRLFISIADNGSGMDSEALKTLNEMFLRSEYRPEEEQEGRRNMGIALPNINARIKLTFGQSYGLVAYATPGMGTEIMVLLPAAEE